MAGKVVLEMSLDEYQSYKDWVSASAEDATEEVEASAEEAVPEEESVEEVVAEAVEQGAEAEITLADLAATVASGFADVNAKFAAMPVQRGGVGTRSATPRKKQLNEMTVAEVNAETDRILGRQE